MLHTFDFKVRMQLYLKPYKKGFAKRFTKFPVINKLSDEILKDGSVAMRRSAV